MWNLNLSPSVEAVLSKFPLKKIKINLFTFIVNFLLGWLQTSGHVFGSESTVGSCLRVAPLIPSPDCERLVSCCTEHNMLTSHFHDV